MANPSAKTFDTETEARLRPHLIRGLLARWWGEAVIVIVAVLLWIPRLSGPIDLRWDGGVYYILGTSLADGRGYRIISEPGAPGAIQYPPLLPIIVALYERALGTADPYVVGHWLRLTYALLFLIYAVITVALARRFLSPVLATAAAALCVLNPFTVFISDLLFTELPFAVITVLFVLVARAPRRSWRYEVSAFSLALAGFLLRTAGLALLLAWVLEAVMCRRWKSALLRASLALVPLMLWLGYIGHVQKSNEYSAPAYAYQRASYQYYNVSYAENIRLVDPFQPELGKLDPATFCSRLANSGKALPLALAAVVSSKEADWRGTILWLQRRFLRHTFIAPNFVKAPLLLIAASVVFGLYLYARRREWLLLSVVFASIALVSSTPWPTQFHRYLAPLSPLLTIAAILGLSETKRWITQRWSETGAILCDLGGAILLFSAMIVELGTVTALFSGQFRQPLPFLKERLGTTAKWFQYDQPWQSWQQAVDWINDKAPPNAILATSSPHFYFLQTGRLAVLPPMEGDIAEERRLLAQVPITFAIVDQFDFVDISRRYLLPAIESDPTWQLVKNFDGTSVYERPSVISKPPAIP